MSASSGGEISSALSGPRLPRGETGISAVRAVSSLCVPQADVALECRRESSSTEARMAATFAGLSFLNVVEECCVLDRRLSMFGVGPVESLIWIVDEFVTCPLRFTVS